MRFVVIDGKKLGLVIIVCGLMVVLFAAGLQFDSRIRSTAFIQSNLGELKSYASKEQNFTYKLPVKWTTVEQNFSGGEILYHNDFKSDDEHIHGFVEVWDNAGDLKTFLINSGEISKKQNEIRNYKIENIKINNKEGFDVTYDTVMPDDVVYKAYEYFIKDTNKFIRFSYYVKERDFKNNMPTIFKTIVQTLNYK